LIKLKLFVVAGLLLPLTTVFADSADWTIAIGKDSSSYETIASLQQDSLTTIKDEYAKQDLRLYGR